MQWKWKWNVFPFPSKYCTVLYCIIVQRKQYSFFSTLVYSGNACDLLRSEVVMVVYCSVNGISPVGVGVGPSIDLMLYSYSCQASTTIDLLASNNVVRLVAKNQNKTQTRPRPMQFMSPQFCLLPFALHLLPYKLPLRYGVLHR